MAPPFVSVILPVHNRASSIARAVESVLAQTYRPLELLVVDDGSTDGTREVLARFGSEIVLLEQQHAGAYAARNLALRHARGELIAFLDSDDAWLPQKLEKQVPLFDREEVGLVFGDAVVVTPEAGRTRRTMFGITAPRRGRVAAHFAWGNFIPTVTVVARRRCLVDFDPELSADYVAWFRVALRYELDYVDDVVAEYTMHPGGMSSDLGRSLESRIALFTRELERTTGRETRAVLRRLLFNLSWHLALAAVRGRARSVEHPLRLARRTASRTGAPGWTASFALHQLVSRGRRLFS
ncbi:MAG TPA: glycosyltransferase family 2 protein [Thermoanaerobaculia bacterium]